MKNVKQFYLDFLNNNTINQFLETEYPLSIVANGQSQACEHLLLLLVINQITKAISRMGQNTPTITIAIPPKISKVIKITEPNTLKTIAKAAKTNNTVTKADTPIAFNGSINSSST